MLGNPAAPVTVVEYGDYECPYCAAAAPVLRELVEESEGGSGWCSATSRSRRTRTR